ncbi:MAG: hypothetical protein J6I49_09655 [Bacteroidales bacterium]|nr:hypothetical protein [Bacteroidales bacterium]
MKTLARALCVAIVAAGALNVSSCIKEGDLDIFTHPIDMQFNFSPHYGFPIAYGELNLNDILTRLAKKDSTVNSYIDTNSDVLTFVFSGEKTDSIFPLSFLGDATNPKAANHKRRAEHKTHHLKYGSHKDTPWYYVDTVFHDTVPIDLFDHAVIKENVVDNGIELTNAWLTLSVKANGEYLNPSWDSLLNPYVHVVFDSVSVVAVGHGNVDDSVSSGEVGINSVVINDITKDTLYSFENIDLAKLFNVYPKEIVYTYRLRLQISPDIVSSDIVTRPFREVLDTLSLTKFFYTAKAKLTLPMSLKVPSLDYAYYLNWNGGSGQSLGEMLDSIGKSLDEGLSIGLDNLSLQLKFDNGIPLGFGLNAWFLDADSTVLHKLVPDRNYIEAAPLQNGTASGSTLTTINFNVDSQSLDKVKQASIIQLLMHLNTSGGQHAAVKIDDFLRIKAYMQVKVNINGKIVLLEEGFKIPFMPDSLLNNLNMF